MFTQLCSQILKTPEGWRAYKEEREPVAVDRWHSLVQAGARVEGVPALTAVWEHGQEGEAQTRPPYGESGREELLQEERSGPSQAGPLSNGGQQPRARLCLQLQDGV